MASCQANQDSCQFKSRRLKTPSIGLTDFANISAIVDFNQALPGDLLEKWTPKTGQPIYWTHCGIC